MLEAVTVWMTTTCVCVVVPAWLEVVVEAVVEDDVVAEVMVDVGTDVEEDDPALEAAPVVVVPLPVAVVTESEPLLEVAALEEEEGEEVDRRVPVIGGGGTSVSELPRSDPRPPPKSSPALERLPVSNSALRRSWNSDPTAASAQFPSE